ncbi:MAG: hypothetical protein JWM80_5932 [Cyanobacteria bacterium RYN_339]|nr:hypothetical protein [Cyanobacteria bacterium RYN_339]
MTEQVGGVVAQKLRYVDVLLINPWQLEMTQAKGFKVPDDATVNIANPICYLAQKLLVLSRRPLDKQAKDILYIHDTLNILAPSFDKLNAAWPAVKQEMPHLWVTDLQKQVNAPFTASDLRIIGAAEIARTSGRPEPPSPERIGEVCRVGLKQIFSDDAN